MKKIDLERLSRAMPYKPLDDTYFEQLPLDTLAKIEAQCDMECDKDLIITRSSRWSLTRPLSMAAAATMVAAAMVALFVAVDIQESSTAKSSDEQIDDFVSALSDSDLELLLNEAESNYEFYTNL